MRSLVPSLARRIPPIQITLCSAHGGTLGLNRTKQGIDSPVYQTSLMAKSIASGEIKEKYDSDSSGREVRRNHRWRNRRQQRNKTAHLRLSTEDVAIN